jgi:hypothetical protein
LIQRLEAKGFGPFCFFEPKQADFQKKPPVFHVDFGIGSACYQIVVAIGN